MFVVHTMSAMAGAMQNAVLPGVDFRVMSVAFLPSINSFSRARTRAPHRGATPGGADAAQPLISGMVAADSSFGVWILGNHWGPRVSWGPPHIILLLMEAISGASRAGGVRVSMMSGCGGRLGPGRKRRG